MNPVVANRVVLFAGVARRPDVIQAARRLAQDGYEMVIVGPGGPAAALRMDEAGVKARLHLGDPIACLRELAPAVVVLGSAVDAAGSLVPHQLCLAPRPCGHAGCQPVDCLDAWAQDYLAPRVPRLHFTRNSA